MKNTSTLTTTLWLMFLVLLWGAAPIYGQSPLPSTIQAKGECDDQAFTFGECGKSSVDQATYLLMLIVLLYHIVCGLFPWISYSLKKAVPVCVILPLPVVQGKQA